MAIVPQAYFDIEPESLITAGSDITSIVAMISNVNGDSFVADTATVELVPIVPNEHKKVLFESYTGTWCQWCPRSNVLIDDMLSKYPEYAANVAIHIDDVMTAPDFESVFAPYLPSCKIMDNYMHNHQTYLPRFFKEIQEEPICAVSLVLEYDSLNNMLNVETQTTFLEDASGNYLIKVILTENNVSGTTDEWAQ